MNFYNDNDEKVCAWSRALVKAGEIPAGDVVCKSIADIKPDELKPYTQCHFFNGLSGWAYALKIAGWPTESQVWCASLPCQPFSTAGKQKGMSDERHLWPVFFDLVRECRPQFILGEQVEAAVRLGWLDGVFADLEGEGYTVGAVVLGAHSAGAPHIRQRIYWMAHARSSRQNGTRKGNERAGRTPFFTASCGATGSRRLVQSDSAGRDEGQSATEAAGHRSSTESAGRDVGVGDTMREGRQGQSLGLLGASGEGHWGNFDILPCRDGKWRRVETGTFPLAHGISQRVGLLRGYGNAIVAPCAAMFIQAVMEEFSIC